MNNLISINIMLALVILALGCDREEAENRTGQTTVDPGESLIKTNRYLVKSEIEDIENYIRRHQWEMKETGSGLRYMIAEQGNGPKVKDGDIITIRYNLWLINGNLVYNSIDDGPKTFFVGKGGVESGLEEGVLLLHDGDKARFILPAHLAYGLLGDEKKIPPRTAIVYELELIKIK